MKKLIFIILVMLFTLPVLSQQRVSGLLNLVVDAYDMSTLTGADTSFAFYFKNVTVLESPWSIQITWTGVTGTGTIELEVSNDNSGYIDYHGSLSTSITGASGQDGWEDDRFAWRYGRLKLTKGTLSAGTLNIFVNL